MGIRIKDEKELAKMGLRVDPLDPSKVIRIGDTPSAVCPDCGELVSVGPICTHCGRGLSEEQRELLRQVGQKLREQTPKKGRGPKTGGYPEEEGPDTGGDPPESGGDDLSGGEAEDLHVEQFFLPFQPNGNREIIDEVKGELVGLKDWADSLIGKLDAIKL